jgi:hypothetical protein
MPDPTNFRMQRIEKLLAELRYEIERGMMEQDIDETIGYSFYVPRSVQIPDGVVQCIFHTRPILRHMMPSGIIEPRLKLMKGGKKDD